MWFQRTSIPVTQPPPGLVYALSDSSGNTTYWLVDSTGQAISWDLVSDAYEEPVCRSCCDCECSPYQQCQENDICFVDPQTGEEHNITNTPDRVEWPTGLTLSNPDVLLLYSITITEDLAQSQGVLGEGWPPHQLSTVRTDGSQYTVISELFSGEPALSADGRYLAFEDGPGAWLYDANTGLHPFLLGEFGLPLTNTGLHTPGWSPVEHTITWWINFYTVTGSTQALGIFNLDDKTARIFKDYQPAMNLYETMAPVWSPDGRWISFLGKGPESDFNHIWVLNADGLEKLNFGEFDQFVGYCDQAWSPDSQWLAFSCWTYPDKSCIWLAQISTGKLFKADLPDKAEVRKWVDR